MTLPAGLLGLVLKVEVGLFADFGRRRLVLADLPVLELLDEHRL